MSRPQTDFTLADFRVEMEKRGGMDCKFVCPACGHKASPRDFLDLKADAQRAPQECLGRVYDFGVGQGSGCDFVAYGLIPGPRTVSMPDGQVISVFDFAEEVDA